MQIREIVLSELDTVYKLINQKYETMNYQEYEDLIYQMIKENYKIIVMIEKNKPIIYIGLKIQTDLINKRHLCIYEFIIDKAYKSTYYIQEMENYLKTYAKTYTCETIIKEIQKLGSDLHSHTCKVQYYQRWEA